MDWSSVATQVRVQGYVLCREWQCKAVGCYIRSCCILIILHFRAVPCATVVVCFVSSIAVPHRIAVLCLQFLDAAVYIVVCTAYVVVPAVTLTGKLQAALLPDIIECESGLSYESLPLVCTSAYLIEAIQRKLVSRIAHQNLCLCVNQIDI